MADILRVIHAQTAPSPSNASPPSVTLSPEAPFTPQPVGTGRQVYRPVGPDNITNIAELPSILINDLEDGTRRDEADGNIVSLGKGPVYLPYESAPGVPGFIDLVKDSKAVFSAAKGEIAKLVAAGLVTTLDIPAGSLVAPVLVTADFDVPGAGDVTLSGSGFLSSDPIETVVNFTGPGAQTIVCDNTLLPVPSTFISGGGTISDVSIVIPVGLLLAGLDDTGAPGPSAAEVVADGLSSGAPVLLA